MQPLEPLDYADFMTANHNNEQVALAAYLKAIKDRRADREHQQKAELRQYEAECRQRLARQRRQRHHEQYAANPEKFLEQSRQWQKDNPEQVLELARKHRALDYGLTTWLTAEQWQTIKEFYGNRCLCCGRGEDELRTAELTLSPDHVIPLALGGKCSPENIQPLCHQRKKGVRWGCNNLKGDESTDYRPRERP